MAWHRSLVGSEPAASRSEESPKVEKKKKKKKKGGSTGDDEVPSTVLDLVVRRPGGFTHSYYNPGEYTTAHDP